MLKKTTESKLLAGYIYGGVPYEALEAAGALRISGDIKLAERFRSLFSLPPKFVIPAR